MITGSQTGVGDGRTNGSSHAKPRLVVHLGFPKTGTTTIQRMLAKNTNALAPSLVVSAKDDLTYRLRKYALRYRRTGYAYWKWRHDNALRTMVRRIDAMAFETLIISDENMTGMESGKLFMPDAGKDYAEWLARLDGAFSRYDVTYVLYTRAVEPWQVSSYNQAFKMRRVTEPFDQWRLRHNNLHGPDQIIASLRDVVGDRLKAVRMEDDLRAGRLMGQALLELAGVPSDRIAALAPPARSNESLPATAIELLQRIHETPGIRRRQYRELVRLFARHPEFFARETSRESK